MKRSHIRLPKGHMKPFTYHQNRLIFVLDIQKKEILFDDIKFVDTEVGFYEDDVETLMNDMCENQFFSLRQKLVNFFEEKVTNLKIHLSDISIIINYLNFSILRGKSTLKIVNEESIVAKMFGEYTSNDLVKTKLYGIQKESMFEGYGVIVAKNKSNVNLVLPSNAFYYSHNLLKSKVCADHFIVVPITPNIAFILIPYKENILFFKEFNSYFMVLENNEDIYMLNELALNTELENDRKFIVSKTNKELEKLLAIIECNQKF